MPGRFNLFVQFIAIKGDMSSLKVIGLLLLIALAVSSNIRRHSSESSQVHRAGEHASTGGDDVSSSIKNELTDKFARLIILLKSSEDKAKGVIRLDAEALFHETELINILGPYDERAISILAQGKNPNQDREYIALDEKIGHLAEKSFNLKKESSSLFQEAAHDHGQAQKIGQEINELIQKVRSKGRESSSKPDLSSGHSYPHPNASASSHPHANASNSTKPHPHVNASNNTKSYHHVDYSTSSHPHANASNSTKSHPHANASNSTKSHPHVSASNSTKSHPHVSASNSTKSYHHVDYSTPSHPHANASNSTKSHHHTSATSTTQSNPHISESHKA